MHISFHLQSNRSIGQDSEVFCVQILNAQYTWLWDVMIWMFIFSQWKKCSSDCSTSVCVYTTHKHTPRNLSRVPWHGQHRWRSLWLCLPPEGKKATQFRTLFACWGPRFDQMENYSAGNFTVDIFKALLGRLKWTFCQYNGSGMELIAKSYLKH